MATSPNPFDQFDTPPAVVASGSNPFDKFDSQPAPQEQPLLSRLMSKLTGGLDAGAAGLSGLLVGGTAEPLAGLAARATGHDPAQWKQWVDQNMVYHPQTAEGQAIDHAADPVQHAIGTGVNMLDQGIGKYAGPQVQNIARQAVGTAGDIAGSVPALGLLGKSAQAYRAAADAATANSVARAPDEVARAAGFRVRPADIQDATGVSAQPSIARQAGEVVGGIKDMRIEDIRHNKAQVNNIAAQDIGLPANTPLTDANIQTAKKPFAAVYDKIEQIPATDMRDPAFTQAVLNAGKRQDSTLRLPASVRADMTDLLSRPTMTGKQMVDTISDLRSSGWKGFYSDDPTAHAVGSARLDMANALDNRLADAADAIDPALGAQYKEARVGFARIQTVQNARVGLDVDPQRIAKAAAKSNAIDGGLKVIADVATSFPKVMSRTVPEGDTGALHRFVSVSTLGIKPAIGKLSRILMNATDGSAAAPMIGRDGPLGYYYRDRPTDTRQAFPPTPLTQRLLPSPLDMPINQGNEGLNAADMGGGPYGHPGEPAPVNQNRFLALPAPGQTSDGAIAPINQGNESLNASDRFQGPYGHPGEARPAMLALPAPGQTAAGRLGQMLVNPDVAINHPGAGGRRVPSTVTKRERRELMDHLVQVLAYRKKTGELQ